MGRSEILEKLRQMQSDMVVWLEIYIGVQTQNSLKVSKHMLVVTVNLLDGQRA